MLEDRPASVATDRFETGSATVRNSQHKTATETKIGRYCRFLLGPVHVAGPLTYYSKHFSDGYKPVVVFSTRTEARRDTIVKVAEEYWAKLMRASSCGRSRWRRLAPSSDGVSWGDTARSFARPQPSTSHKASDAGGPSSRFARSSSSSAFTKRRSTSSSASATPCAQASRSSPSLLSQGDECGSNGAAQTPPLGPQTATRKASDAKTSEDFALFNVRLPAGTVERIQRYRDYLNQTQPGIEASASTAARMLLFRALEQVEEEMGSRKGL